VQSTISRRRITAALRSYEGATHIANSLIEIRRAEAPDALALASTHNDAWRNAYQGIIPGPELEKLINRRGGKWREGAIRQGSRISILTFGDTVAGYADYGRNRARSCFRERPTAFHRQRCR
jgi:hypothetical protein